MTAPGASPLKPPPPDMAEEMRRQPEDARASFAANGPVAERIAASARRTGRLLLLGMGGSHAVNRVMEPLYRAAGLDANAVVVSELLDVPLKTAGATVLLNSQSGESGEVVAYLGRNGGGEERFGLTLDAASTLARTVPSLLGAGGVEHAFAATRSLTVSLALHARVLQALGIPSEAIVERATRREPVLPADAVAALASVEAVVFSGPGPMAGSAEIGALGILELSRIPAFALEGGQLRHGPVEALGPKLGVVFVRAEGGEGSTAALAATCVEGGSPTIVFDLSGKPAVDGAVTVPFPPCGGLEAALTVLPTLQRFLIAFAGERVEHVGRPLRSSKVTRGT